MKKWPIRIGRGVAMGLGWGAAWVPVALLVARIVDPNDSMDEPWLVVGMLPGFLCGAVFSAVAGIADGRRGLDELSFIPAGARGVLSGLLVGGLWLVLALVSDPPNWLLNAEESHSCSGSSLLLLIQNLVDRAGEAGQHLRSD